MKKLKALLRRQDGFTLVELMVVVAIIGLLSAVAIPNFRKYQSKSRISEAKLQLSAIYTAEASFFSDFNIYHNCLTYMGFDPGPEFVSRFFAVGIANAAANVNESAYSAAVNTGLNSVECPRANTISSGGAGSRSMNSATWFPAGKGVGANIASTVDYLTTATGGGATTSLGTQDTQANMFYTAGAAGVISVDDATFGTNAGASYLDINQNKIIRQRRNGY
jgi:type IV pilus assembly protein PilA